MLKCENARKWRLFGYGYAIGVFLTLLQGRPLLLYAVQMYIVFWVTFNSTQYT